MSPRGRRLLTGLPLATLLSLAATPAMADVTKEQCIDANGNAQSLRRAGKLAAAREQLLLCSTPSCPAVVRDDCAKRLDELEGAQPTIAFEVKDASGADVIVVKITVDGKPLAEKVDGTALRVDIGEHVFKFEVAGQPPVTRKVVLAEGEKERRERIDVGAATPQAVPGATPRVPGVGAGTVLPPSSAGEAAPSGGGLGAQKILGLVAGGAGVASFVVGSVFGAMTLSEKSQQQSDCSTSCSPAGHAKALDDHSAGMTDGTISTVGFVAGGVLLVGGAALFFTAGHGSESTRATTGTLLVPSVAPGGGGMVLRGEF